MDKGVSTPEQYAQDAYFLTVFANTQSTMAEGKPSAFYKTTLLQPEVQQWERSKAFDGRRFLYDLAIVCDVNTNSSGCVATAVRVDKKAREIEIFISMNGDVAYDVQQTAEMVMANFRALVKAAKSFRNDADGEPGRFGRLEQAFEPRNRSEEQFLSDIYITGYKKIRAITNKWAKRRDVYLTRYIQCVLMVYQKFRGVKDITDMRVPVADIKLWLFLVGHLRVLAEKMKRSGLLDRWREELGKSMTREQYQFIRFPNEVSGIPISAGSLMYLSRSPSIKRLADCEITITLVPGLRVNTLPRNAVFWMDRLASMGVYGSLRSDPEVAQNELFKGVLWAMKRTKLKAFPNAVHAELAMCMYLKHKGLSHRVTNDLGTSKLCCRSCWITFGTALPQIQLHEAHHGAHHGWQVWPMRGLGNLLSVPDPELTLRDAILKEFKADWATHLEIRQRGKGRADDSSTATISTEGEGIPA